MMKFKLVQKCEIRKENRFLLPLPDGGFIGFLPLWNYSCHSFIWTKRLKYNMLPACFLGLTNVLNKQAALQGYGGFSPCSMMLTEKLVIVFENAVRTRDRYKQNTPGSITLYKKTHRRKSLAVGFGTLYLGCVTSSLNSTSEPPPICPPPQATLSRC
jgi:hypothetical protein